MQNEITEPVFPAKKRPPVKMPRQSSPLWTPDAMLGAGTSANPNIQWTTTATPAVYLSATDVLEGT